MRNRFYDTVTDLLDTHPRLTVVLADIGVERLREQAMVGVAGGLALTGMRPVVHTYAPFLVERAYEQVKLDLGHQDVGALLVSTGASHDAAEEGRTHQAPADVALMAALPGWTVHAPGHPAELEDVVRRAAATDDRVYVRMSTRSNATARSADGRVQLVRGGTGPLVLAVGPALDDVLAACAGLPVRVAWTATPHPLDAAGLRAAAGDEQRVAVVEPYLAGTSAAAVAEAFADRPVRAVHVGVRRDVEVRRYGTPADHDAVHGLDPTGIRRRVATLLR